jgi:hypothetical protein
MSNVASIKKMVSGSKVVSRYGVHASHSGNCTRVEQSFVAQGPAETAANKAAQLQALLHMTYGEQDSAFSRMNEELRDNLMWLAADLSGQIRVLCDLAK